MPTDSIDAMYRGKRIIQVRRLLVSSALASVARARRAPCLQPASLLTSWPGYLDFGDARQAAVKRQQSNSLR